MTSGGLWLPVSPEAPFAALVAFVPSRELDSSRAESAPRGGRAEATARDAAVKAGSPKVLSAVRAESALFRGASVGRTSQDAPRGGGVGGAVRRAGSFAARILSAHWTTRQTTMRANRKQWWKAVI